MDTRRDNADPLAPRVVFLPPDYERQALEKFAIIRPLLDWRVSAVRSKTQLVKHLSITNGRGEATIWRWLREYETGGLLALATQHRSDKGTSRYFRNRPDVELLVLAMVRYKPPLAALALWRKLHKLLAEGAPGRETVRCYVRRLERQPASAVRLRMLAVSGFEFPFSLSVLKEIDRQLSSRLTDARSKGATGQQ